MLAAMVAREGSGGFFAQSDPADRKRLLYSILDLDRYGLLAKLASDKAAKINLDAIEKEIKELQDIIIDKQELKEALFAKNISLESLEDKLKLLIPKLQSVREERVRLETKTQEALTKINELETKSGHLVSQEQKIKITLNEQNKILAQEKDIRQAAKEKEKHEAGLQKLQIKLEEQTLALSDIQNKEKSLKEERDDYIDSLMPIRQAKGEDEKEIGIINTNITNAKKQSSILASIPCPEEYQAKCPAVSQARDARDKIKDLIKEEKKFTQRLKNCKKDEEAFVSKINIIDKKIEGSESIIQQEENKSKQIKKEIKAIQDLISFLSKKVVLITQIEVALSKKEMLEKEQKKIQSDANIIQQDIERIKKDSQEYLDKIKPLKGQISSIDEDINQETQNRDDCKEQIVSIKNKLTQISQYEEKIKKLSEQFDVQAKEKKIYNILANAFKTIPILILEHAKPIVEQEANRILTKISDTGMRISLPLFKALKSSDKVVETLDIRVQDQVGERPYQMFSSGERVRLDLALRIGLSRLLMLRSGTRIGTLILDEGFGPLDQSGIESFKECLRELHRLKEFELLIVVTHIETLKDIFPTHMLFSKNNDISHIEVFD